MEMPAKIHWHTRSGLPTKQVGSLSIQRNSNWNFPAENRVFQKNMNLTDYIARIRTHLLQTHADVIAWFAEGEHLRAYSPKDQGWAINEILEHIALTSHFFGLHAERHIRQMEENKREFLELSTP